MSMFRCDIEKKAEWNVTWIYSKIIENNARGNKS